MENVSWRDIRPDKQYNEVRRLFIQQQKKRKFEEYKKHNQAAAANSFNQPMKKKFKPNEL